jgi:glycosyltransferase involved in cell wall biosynthesis
MRILAITNLYPNPYQPERAAFNRQQLRMLAAAHPLMVIAPILWTDELAARRRCGNRLPPDRRVLCDGIRVDHPRYVYTPKVLRNWYGPFFRHCVRPAFETALAEFCPDLIFAPWVYPDGWAAVELGHGAGLPVVVKEHGSDILALERHPQRRHKTLETLRRADGVVAVSRDLAARTIELGVDPGRIRVVYDGIDARRFSPGQSSAARTRLGLSQAEPVLLFVGNLVPVKGLLTLLHACARLAREGRRFTCHLVGEGPMRGVLCRAITRLGLAGRVRLVGGCAHEHLADWYRAADLFVLPSRSEGIPVVLLEAAACGTPFVASDVGGIPEVAHLAPSRLVPPGDPDRLAEAIAAGLTVGFPRPGGPGKPPRSHAAAVAELLDLFESVLSPSRNARDD